jgi:cobaltochelatase CobT
MAAPAPAGPRRQQWQQQAEELSAATLRALSGDARLQFRGGHLHQGGRLLPIHAPHLRIDTAAVDYADCRALADAVSLRLQYTDTQQHEALRPADGIERLVFEWLEQLRVETLADPALPGQIHNLRYRFEHWARDYHRGGLTRGQLGMLMYTMAQMCWSRLTGYPVLEETEEMIEGMRAGLAEPLGVALAGLRRNRNDQAAYAVHALAIAKHVASELPPLRRDEDDAADATDEDDDEARRRFRLLLNFEGEGESVIAKAETGESRAFGESADGYRIFTRAYDAEVEAATLVRRAQLTEFRERLDQRVAAQGINLRRLARELRELLAMPRQDGWSFEEEEGRIDGRRLSRLVSSPTERRIFRQDRFQPAADDCVLSLLVDCSGSMKNNIEAVATLADILLRAFEMAGVKSELLGFTTGAWNGGRPQREWLAAGSPPAPGRLNEACHMVFKPLDRPWRRARAGVAALLKADLFREGVDGEAVDWACERLLARDARRRILIVISDGCPNDAATRRANDAFYLDNHLKEVVARREQQGAVEVLGLGVGLDLSPFYRRCLAIDLAATLDNAVFHEILQLTGGRHRR